MIIHTTNNKWVVFSYHVSDDRCTCWLRETVWRETVTLIRMESPLPVFKIKPPYTNMKHYILIHLIHFNKSRCFSFYSQISCISRFGSIVAFTLKGRSNPLPELWSRSLCNYPRWRRPPLASRFRCCCLETNIWPLLISSSHYCVVHHRMETNVTSFYTSK